MTHQRWLVVFILIAISPYSHWARADKVYKCGTTYSQMPCPGGTTLELADTRDSTEKKRMDAQTKRDAKLALTMQQSRLANEAALDAERTQQIKRAKKLNSIRQTAIEPAAEPELVYARKPRLERPKKPKVFVAVVPGTTHKTNKRHNKRPESAR